MGDEFVPQKGYHTLTEVGSERWKTTVTDARSFDTLYVLNKDGSPLEIHEPGAVVTTMVWATDDITKLEETDAEDDEHL